MKKKTKYELAMVKKMRKKQEEKRRIQEINTAALKRWPSW